MSIDPARLARIRARLLAAAALTTAAAGCAKPIINDRMGGPPEETINERRPEPEPTDNEAPKTPTAEPAPTAPDTSKPTIHHVNTPPSDGGTKLTPPDPGQTINTAPNQR
ncbi:hypothetical protein [Polyangium jinanense]|uniref:Lipoprotein n=1 Tax=Polyangium jinanense TaxID=2829994 RepID=A0A9X3X109_9BACT|nr:hypothetical protein [Polyangium jinanense]MDC3955391.1 hypothetical protein [Polyangium jinanense]MDC3981692.1 hypothetical protein [Polyangium jinanense]